ncbi:dTDP-4-dehydrorhamnose reductase [Cyanobium sp. Copco_Reservoir_LC18]|uniref:dTDP-4-dehydrorhamnose reductase n=1 Tax=Cyanobium sp. Copco_Reservoir_LC18 TaxID=1328305 RepID=UPI00135BCA6B|nr:dTDP-4-dehydrorhamnose reductase [Cyanobium sp. Copco_Reservoir_LC18]
MPQPVRVLLTGRHGQLGQALLARVPAGIDLIATGRDALDLADADACRAAVAQHRPDWVLNAGAYTAVDRAEAEPELAEAVNAGAPGAFAEALAGTGGRLLQVSTDFVFDGGQGHPYAPEQALAPLGVYGATKAEGERRAAAALPAERLCLLRTSWVYGPVGANFCLTMLRLHRAKAAAGEPLGVVADQVGCPTATAGLAEACWRVIERGVSGRHHWSDCGAASWYDFAVAIGLLAAARGLIPAPARVRPITTADYPTPARRPAYSLLDATTTRHALALEGQHWQAALAEVLARIPLPQA